MDRRTYRVECQSFGPNRVDLVLQGSVLRYEESTGFAFEWDPGAGRTVVELELEPRAGGCVLEVSDIVPRWHRGDTRMRLWMGRGPDPDEFYVEHGLTYASSAASLTSDPSSGSQSGSLRAGRGCRSGRRASRAQDRGHSSSEPSGQLRALSILSPASSFGNHDASTTRAIGTIGARGEPPSARP